MPYASKIASDRRLAALRPVPPVSTPSRNPSTNPNHLSVAAANEGTLGRVLRLPGAQSLPAPSPTPLGVVRSVDDRGRLSVADFLEVLGWSDSQPLGLELSRFWVTVAPAATTAAATTAAASSPFIATATAPAGASDAASGSAAAPSVSLAGRGRLRAAAALWRWLGVALPGSAYVECDPDASCLRVFSPSFVEAAVAAARECVSGGV